MKKRFCVLVLLIICTYIVFTNKSKEELLTWYETGDYDNDGEWDTLNIERYVSDEKTKSFYEIDLSTCGYLRIVIQVYRYNVPI